MNTIPALTIDSRKRLRVQDVQPEGPIIRVTPIDQVRVSEIPLEYLDILKSARTAGTDLSLVTCRRAGMPEAKDKSHLQHFLVSASAQIDAVGVTL